MSNEIIKIKFNELLLPTLLVAMTLNISAVVDSFFVASFIGESAVLSEESTTNDRFKYNLGLCFKLLFSELSNPNSFNIFAHFYYDDEEYVYKIDDSIENQLMDGVFVVDEDDFIPQKNNSDENSFPKELLI